MTDKDSASGDAETQVLLAAYRKLPTHPDKMREILGVYQEALDRIRGIDPDEWYRGDGWKCVAFIQEVADNALRMEQA